MLALGWLGHVDSRASYSAGGCIGEVNHRPITAEHPAALPPLHAPFRRVERIELLHHTLGEVAK